MFISLLIANRGEIACRVIRTARAMGLRTVAVYSDADADAVHVRMADEAVRIGPAPVTDSYLKADAILKAARQTKAEAIHPGYGFLSENAAFAEACRAAGIVFVGPSPEAIRAMGLKDGAKALMEKAGVPVVPGYHGDRQGADFLKKKAYETGYPVLIKAVAGGGGKGMRLVEKAIDFDDALSGAEREAQSAFGDPRVLIERFVPSPRHIEVQVFGDSHGNAIHLFERDCSLQRRHQKVIEEAPAPGMTEGLRARMGEAAVKAAQAVDYTGAGTVEFIVEASKPLNDKTPFYFMEMNTRLQVEHPVTEAVTGLDLVEMQLRVAAGEPLPVTQADIPLAGHAVEARVYAEDPDHDFLPSTGRLDILDLSAGEGIRIDSGVEAGSEISAFYDPMIAKVIAHGRDRNEALDRLGAALSGSLIAGPKTNLAFLVALTANATFRSGRFDTGTIGREGASLLPPVDEVRPVIAEHAARHFLDQAAEEAHAAAVRRSSEPASPWQVGDSFQLGGERALPVPVFVDGHKYTVPVRYGADGIVAAQDGEETLSVAVVAGGRDSAFLIVGGRQFAVHLPHVGGEGDEGDAGDGRVVSPMHGRMVELAVAVGDAVEAGQKVAVVEAMKMEHTVAAPCAGTVTETPAEPGGQIAQGALIALIDPASRE
ncbi:MAG: acetyl-CoA carboxylase biotin carboxylase subunit [Rhodobiaceae bacterium]|nr:acetyl-CoA carboxylase biotin carboxylase subunit [Rhodobiaceae bacterium]